MKQVLRFLMVLLVGAVALAAGPSLRSYDHCSADNGVQHAAETGNHGLEYVMVTERAAEFEYCGHSGVTGLSIDQWAMLPEQIASQRTEGLTPSVDPDHPSLQVAPEGPPPRV